MNQYDKRVHCVYFTVTAAPLTKLTSNLAEAEVGHLRNRNATGIL